MATFHVELVSPEKLLFAGQAESATVPSVDGEMTVLAAHAPLMAVLKPGVVQIRDANQNIRRLFVRGGFADVNPAGLTVLAEYAIPVEEIDTAFVDSQIRDAEEDVRDAKTFEDKQAASEKVVQLRDLRAAASR
ncbi:F-type H+-transporting ATPase subunit epsilon [Pseudochelatococcus lubricantis]|uniref:ATP synthase epsilon chain n=1 Tax=Pseudochelatococcus lubricantis TaxID=1538102 RepID=A0ABX0V2Q2_9HYPH|nr:F0F1 ATP synthase subunit epsilon [Pseudochelatococcus lubricantis]NIJ59508.1 F-type H+-transporting ATPase subunit epsilon [Pseudochelatococcus lubricantis]